MAAQGSRDPTLPNRLRTGDQNGSGDYESTSSQVNHDAVISMDNSDLVPSGVNSPDSLFYVMVDGREKTIGKFSDIKAGQTLKTFLTKKKHGSTRTRIHF